MSEELLLEERLSQFAADTVSFKRNAEFLKRLFEYDAGTMLYANDLCNELGDMISQIAELEGLAKGRLRIGWLDFSDSAYGQGYSLILFFVEEIFWNTLTLYNRNVLE